MRHAGRAAAIAAGILLFVLPAEAQQLWSRRTKMLDLVYYSKAHEPLSYHLTRSFENSLAFHRKLFDYTPSEPVVLLMQDFADFGHGGTSTVPWNYISIGIEPFDYVYDTMPANERMNWLMHHELVHVVATDKAAGSDLMWRRVFHGKVAPIKEEPISMIYSFLSSPRWYSPRWYHEGIAVFLETWMAGGVGRVLGGYDEMAFRTKVLEDDTFFDVVGLESEGTTIDFQVGQNSYLYGTRFVTWLAMQHGPEKLIQWFNRSPGSKRYFSSQFRNVYGVPLETEWRNWIAWEHEWQAQNLERIRSYPVTRQTAIGSESLGSVSRTYYDAAHTRIYAAINRPAKPAQIVSIDAESGKITALSDVFGPALYFVTSLAFDPKGQKLFFTTKNAQGWRDLNELDLQNGRTRRLIRDARTGDLTVNPADGSIWGMQHHDGRSSLVVIAPPYTGWKRLLSLEYGRDLFDIDISPDGKTLSGSVIDITGRQQLVTLDIEKLMKGDASFEVLHEFENNSAANFVFSPDGRYLYGTSYYTGASNVFRYDRETKKTEALTNVESGLFRPLPLSGETMIAYRYTSKGFAPVKVPIAVIEDISAIQYLGQQVVEKYPIVKEWNAGSPARVDVDAVTTYSGLYKPGKFMRLGSVYPVIEGYKSTAAVGMRANFSDPLGLHQVDVTVAVSPSDKVKSGERLHLRATWDHAPWKVKLKYNPTDFYDLFGPTRVSRKGYSASLSRHRYLIYEKPRQLEYTVTGAFYGGLDTLPDFQNVRAPFSRYATLNAHLDYQDLRKTIGGVEPEKGKAWSLAGSGSHVNAKFFPQLWATFDRGFLLPADHTSIWLRTSAGKSWGDRSNPFASFYFGAFGNNWVDYQDARRYRDFTSFPGVKLNELSGTDFVHGIVELDLPPLKFRKAGVPGLYTNWMRLALFTSALSTGVWGGSRRQDAHDIGAQADLSLILFSNLDAMLSVGYAKAFPEGRHSSDEVMVSLKLLR